MLAADSGHAGYRLPGSHGLRLAIDGHDLQRELGMEPGPEVGALLDRLTELVLDEPALNERSTLLDLARQR